MSTADSMRFICNGCGYRARIPTSYTGKVILCPGCQQMQIASADVGDATGDTVRVSRVATAPGTGRFSIPDAEGRLRFTCSGCGYGAKLASTYAGKAIACPQCKSPQVIPPLQGPEGSPGKTLPSSTPESTTAPMQDEELTFAEEPAAPAVSAANPPPEPPRAPAPARSTASAPASRPGGGGVVRRGSRTAMPAVESSPADDEEDEADDQEAVKPPKELSPLAQKLKQPQIIALVSSGVAALILVIVLMIGWSSAAGQAKDNLVRAEAAEGRANDLAAKKADVEFNLSKSNEEVKRLKQTESEAKAALAASETRLAEMEEKLKKAEADKASEYAQRKKAETAQDEMFAKLQEVEKKRNDDYRAVIELRRKYEEEVKLRKDLQVRLTEAQAAAK